MYKEFYRISNALVRFPIVSMDTGFPGVIYHPTRGNSIHDGTLVYFLRPVSNYQALKANVDALKLTMSDSKGNLPNFGTGTCYIWQQGIDFEKNRQKGIDSMIFADLLFRSRLVCNGSLAWVTFHSAYDFGYFIKILTKKMLPYELHNFVLLVHISANNLYGGLERVAKTLEVDREVGNRHQAGSESLITLKTFLKIKEKFFGDGNYYKLFVGVLWP
ncbi:hypothetical protein MKW92_008867 [Papaver armeniacum]|nr:hypothetical protein MKW92_008867 [Papaver armeniacum]